MGKNFIPFAAREVMILDAGETKAAKVTALAISGKKYDEFVVWQDMCVWEPSLYNAYSNSSSSGYDNTLFMRYGLKNRGFLLDRPIPVGVFVNRGRPMQPTWIFDKPYKLYPGQELTVRYIQGGIPQATPAAADAVRKTTPGILFNCVREKDGQPVLLQAAENYTIDVGTERALTSPFLKCPSDSPIRIYGVTHHCWFNYDSDPTYTQPLGIEIYGPNGQSWIHRVVDPSTTLNEQTIIGAWIDPPTSLIELGVDRGWRTPMGSPLVVEFQNIGAVSKEVVLTVRGFAEVDHE